MAQINEEHEERIQKSNITRKYDLDAVLHALNPDPIPKYTRLGKDGELTGIRMGAVRSYSIEKID